MEFKKIDNFNAFAKYTEDWNALLKRSVSPVPFLTPEYLAAWWQTRGGGEWPKDSELVLIAAFEGDELVGIAPLFAAKNQDGIPALMFIGAVEVSDFLDFIVTAEKLPEFLSGLLDFLINSDAIPSWDVLDLQNLLDSSPTLAALQTEAEKRGWQHQQTRLQPSPIVALPGDFEAYLMTLDKKQRHEIRRKLRNAEADPVVPGMYFVEDPEILAAELDAFIDMMAQDPEKKAFLTAPMRTHMHNVARAALENGWLHLSFYTLDGKKAAAHFSFIWENRLWLYNSGWEWEFRSYSPGWLLLANLLRWATENGITAFDFMRGDEDYKYKFGGVDRFVERVVIKK
ncbi:MAG: GNAT family N-acetyltransferase [Anaerolineaceae bacterium]|nr:GNAT family N-acetyltransferase [Anaerolineaceae bacterium]